MSKPVCYDLYCGLFGWGTAFAQEGYRVIGFDIEDMSAVLGIPRPEGCELRIRDVRSIHGSELKDATCIVGSSPCQEFSYRAMPWKKAKALPPPYLGMELFNAQFRIQREACEAAGHYIPMVVENVRGAQKWVGRAQYHFGSFYLWGDAPALMPIPMRARKVPAIPAHDRSEFGWNKSEEFQSMRREGIKGGNAGSRTFSERRSIAANNPELDPNNWWHAADGTKFSQSGDAWFDGKPRDKMLGNQGPAAYGSRSLKRKMASAMIAKIPWPLSSHIARTFRPVDA